MLILIMGVAHTKALVLDLTPPAASKRHKGRIATDPLLTTRRFHQRRRGIDTEAAMLAGNRLGFHPVVCHSVSLSDSGRGSVLPGARLRGVSHSRSLSPIEVVASFTSGGTASNLGIERCGKINGLNSGSETWTGIGVVAGFLAGMGMIEWFYLKITKLPKKDYIIKYYNMLGEL